MSTIPIPQGATIGESGEATVPIPQGATIGDQEPRQSLAAGLIQRKTLPRKHGIKSIPLPP
jgi:hypothetical protein